MRWCRGWSSTTSHPCGRTGLHESTRDGVGTYREPGVDASNPTTNHVEGLYDVHDGGENGQEAANWAKLTVTRLRGLILPSFPGLSHRRRCSRPMRERHWNIGASQAFIHPRLGLDAKLKKDGAAGRRIRLSFIGLWAVPVPILGRLAHQGPMFESSALTINRHRQVQHGYYPQAAIS